jgi:hypothetical protein
MRRTNRRHKKAKYNPTFKTRWLDTRFRAIKFMCADIKRICENYKPDMAENLMDDIKILSLLSDKIKEEVYNETQKYIAEN